MGGLKKRKRLQSDNGDQPQFRIDPAQPRMSFVAPRNGNIVLSHLEYQYDQVRQPTSYGTIEQTNTIGSSSGFIHDQSREIDCTFSGNSYSPNPFPSTTLSPMSLNCAPEIGARQPKLLDLSAPESTPHSQSSFQGTWSTTNQSIGPFPQSLDSTLPIAMPQGFERMQECSTFGTQGYEIGGDRLMTSSCSGEISFRPDCAKGFEELPWSTEDNICPTDDLLCFGMVSISTFL